MTVPNVHTYIQPYICGLVVCRALPRVGNPYGYGYVVDFGWIWIFFREKFWSAVDTGVKIPECLQNTYSPYPFLIV